MDDFDEKLANQTEKPPGFGVADLKLTTGLTSFQNYAFSKAEAQILIERKKKGEKHNEQNILRTYNITNSTT